MFTLIGFVVVFLISAVLAVLFWFARACLLHDLQCPLGDLAGGCWRGSAGKVPRLTWLGSLFKAIELAVEIALTLTVVGVPFFAIVKGCLLLCCGGFESDPFAICATVGLILGPALVEVIFVSATFVQVRELVMHIRACWKERREMLMSNSNPAPLSTWRCSH